MAEAYYRSFQYQQKTSYPVEYVEETRRVKIDLWGLQSAFETMKLVQGKVVGSMETERIITEVKTLSGKVEKVEQVAIETKAFIERETKALRERGDASDLLLKETKTTSESTRQLLQDWVMNLRNEVKGDTNNMLNSLLQERIEPRFNGVAHDVEGIRRGTELHRKSLGKISDNVDDIHKDIQRYGPWNLVVQIVGVLGVLGVIWAILTVAPKLVK